MVNADCTLGFICLQFLQGVSPSSCSIIGSVIHLSGLVISLSCFCLGDFGLTHCSAGMPERWQLQPALLQVLLPGIIQRLRDLLLDVGSFSSLSEAVFSSWQGVHISASRGCILLKQFSGRLVA